MTHVFRGMAMNYLCLAAHGMGAYAEAEQACQESLAFWERTQGPGSPQVAAGMNNLGVVYAAMGRTDEAEALQAQALERRLKIFGPDHLEVAITLGNLAELYRQRGELAKAVEYNRRALAIWEKRRTGARKPKPCCCAPWIS